MALHFNTLRPRQNGCHFTDDICKCIFLNENVSILIKMSLKFIPEGPINNIPALVQIMAWRRPGNRPLSESMVFSLLMHICVTQCQWVNWSPDFLECMSWRWRPAFINYKYLLQEIKKICHSEIVTDNSNKICWIPVPFVWYDTVKSLILISHMSSLAIKYMESKVYFEKPNTNSEKDFTIKSMRLTRLHPVVAWIGMKWVLLL